MTVADENAQAPSEATSRRDTLRLPRPAPGATPGPVNMVALRAVPGQPGYQPLDVVPQGKLAVPEGLEGEAEVCLGRADTSGALVVADKLGFKPGPSAGTLTDEQALARTIAVRANLMEGRRQAAVEAMNGHRDDPRMALADAGVALAQGDLARADARVKAALQRRPEGVAEHYTLALVHAARGNLHDALEELVEVSRSAPLHAVARYQLSQVLVAMGDPARGGTLLEMAMVLAPAFVAPFVTLAELMFRSRQYRESLGILEDLFENVPGALNARLLQLRIFLEVGEKRGALALASALRESVPDHPEVRVLWAEALVGAGETDKAREALKSWVDDPGVDRVRVRRLLAKVETQTQHAAEALDHLKAAYALERGMGETLLDLVKLAVQQGRHDDARQALESLPTNPEIDVDDLVSAAMLARSCGLMDTARSLADSARKLVAGSPAEAQLDAFASSLKV
ncbi:MAG: tetratricopeptide repeat protein [Myxococcota bacterium]